MDLSKETIKRIRGLIVFAAVLVIVLWKYEKVFEVLGFLVNIIFPFVIGGAVAFILNVPMSFIERKIFDHPKVQKHKLLMKLKQPMSLVLAILFVIGLLGIVIFIVVPELARTFVLLGENIRVFIPKMQEWAVELFHNNPQIIELVESIQINWGKMLQNALDFFKNGAGSMLNTTFEAVKSIVSVVTTFFIALVFACYVLLQKRELGFQIRKVLYAFLPEKNVHTILDISSLTYRTFSNFITGQCTEAVILGMMFFVTMTILRMPYALLIGVLIAFTALIPIFGAFIGCVVGAFLILMVNPMQAVGFVVLFLILQQVEGNFIYPHVVGGSVGLPSIWVFVAVSLGGSLMGLVGMLIFIPLVSVLYTLFRGYVNQMLDRKKIVVK